MSFGGGNGGYNGGRTRMGTKVMVNLYDLSDANEYLYTLGMGLHHTGVEIMGTEYSFASNAGIFESTPKEAPGAKFRHQIYMGAFDGGQNELKKILDELRIPGFFGPNDYNLIRKNCNSFANTLCYRLLGKTIPGYVNRLADVAVCCDCLLPRQLLENAPVGDPDGSNNSNGNNSSGVYGGGGREFRGIGGGGGGGGAAGSGGPTAPQSNSMRAFSGAGSRLGGGGGGGSSGSVDPAPRSGGGLMESLLGRGSGGSGGGGPSSGNNTKGVDDLTDRREKARKAALARLEKQQQSSAGGGGGGVTNEQKDK